jgi:MoaA/NifB/PqqE/SkfB family radical SAM enzyme
VAGIESTAAFARAEGAAGVIFERFVPLGTGRGFAGTTLDASGWHQALAAIAGLAGLDADPLGLCPYHALWLSFGPEGNTSLTGARCNLGDEAMALMPDGTVYPCRRLPIRVACAFDQPMETIRRRLRAWSPEALRPRLRGAVCGICGMDDCNGCRALARAAGGDLLGDDPLCPLASTAAGHALPTGFDRC